MTLLANVAVTCAQAGRVVSHLRAAGLNGPLLGTINNKIADALSGNGAQQAAAAIWLTAVLPKLRDFCSAIAADVPNAAAVVADLNAIVSNL